MLTKVRRWFLRKWQSLDHWIKELDACELCGNEKADCECVGCDRRICCMCNSGYYEDVELCTDCRKEISPQEEQADCEDTAQNLAEECQCPSACELTGFEHNFIKAYAPKEKV